MMKNDDDESPFISINKAKTGLGRREENTRTLEMAALRGVQLKDCTIRPLLLLLSRKYASRPALVTEGRQESTKQNLPSPELKVSRMSNGTVIAALENHSPVASLSAVVAAGSRHEDLSLLGSTHCLRASAFLTNRRTSMFKIQRCIDMVGGNLEITSTREYTMYSMNALRDHIHDLANILGGILTKPLYYPWELHDIRQRMRLEKSIAMHSTHMAVLEDLHMIAYKNALRNSLYCPDFMMEKFTQDMMMDFIHNHITSSRLAVVGIGMSHDAVQAAAERHFKITEGSGRPIDKVKYIGGEHRVHTDSKLVHTLLVAESSSVVGPQAGAFAVLQHVLGAGPYTKRGLNSGSKLSPALNKASRFPSVAMAFNASYSDSGLFGIYSICPSEAVSDVIGAGLAEIKAIADGKLTEDEVNRARMQVRARLLMSAEEQKSVLHELGSQALFTGKFVAPTEAAESLNSIVAANVVDAAKKVFAGKKTMVSHGDLSHTPFLDEL
uniref:cytochrome b-c1 complex subunit 2, mitochondrial n=1 Tax=Myxine glutinosa TaxID=7769 RepID=UPI00358DF3C1